MLASTLHGELVGLGFERSYPTLVRELAAWICGLPASAAGLAAWA